MVKPCTYSRISDDRQCLSIHFWICHDMGTVSLRTPIVPSLLTYSILPRGIWILTGETFPTRTRSMQASLAAGSNWLWNFLLAFFTPFITKPIKYRYGFVFAGRSSLSSVANMLKLVRLSSVQSNGSRNCLFLPLRILRSFLGACRHGMVALCLSIHQAHIILSRCTVILIVNPGVRVAGPQKDLLRVLMSLTIERLRKQMIHMARLWGRKMVDMRTKRLGGKVILMWSVQKRQPVGKKSDSSLYYIVQGYHVIYTIHAYATIIFYDHSLMIVRHCINIRGYELEPSTT